MPTAFTPNLQLPYPEGSDPAAVPKDIKALADKLDGIVLPSANSQNLQPGDLITSAAVARAGCLICDGAPYLRADYPALFQAIGVAYGAGDGSTTFNVPDYRGRTIMGAGAGPGLTNRALGARGGEEAHALSTAEMPAHSHGGTTQNDSPDHAHSGQTGGASVRHNHNTTSIFASACTAGPAGFYSASGSTTTGVDNQDHSHSVTTGGASARHTHAIYAEGGGAGHNNVPPFATANVFIKT